MRLKTSSYAAANAAALTEADEGSCGMLEMVLFMQQRTAWLVGRIAGDRQPTPSAGFLVDAWRLQP
jgi:hypothetical protein